MIKKFLNYFIKRNKKNLVIFIGSQGVLISVFDNNILKNTIFLNKNDEHTMLKYKEILKMYKNYQIRFLLDTSNIKLYHEIIMILQSVVLINPIEKFINNNFGKDSIVAHNIYNITTNNIETWEVVFALSPYESPFSNFIEYVIKQSLDFKGVYFFSLESELMINLLLEKSNRKQHKDDLQIFIALLQVSGIKIIVKHKKNIMDIITLEYSNDKSILYFQGIIESYIRDKIDQFQDYIKGLNLNICIILLYNKMVKFKLNNIAVSDFKIVVITEKDIINSRTYTEFYDNFLLVLFNSSNFYKAFNSTLRFIKKISIWNAIVFYIMIFFSVILLSSILLLCYQTNVSNIKVKDLDKKYNTFSQEYLKIKKKYPIDNITNLVNLYYFGLLLKVDFPLPFQQLQELLLVDYKNIKITSIEWVIDKKHFFSITNIPFTVTIDFLILDHKNEEKKLEEILLQFINEVGKIFLLHTKSYVINSSENILPLNKVSFKVSVRGIL